MIYPKVSIIIPMYNEQRYIDRCLNSLEYQSYKDFEVILIDDGSKDDTVKIAETFHTKFPLTILKQKNSGPGKARNRGAKQAKGDVFVFVDADMYFDKNFIHELISPILAGKEEGTAHGIEKIGNPENIRAKTWGLDRIPNPPKRSLVYRAITKNAFRESGGYSNDRFAFEDNLGGEKGISALTVMSAICYHNNPENLKEVFKHDKWIGESLVAKGMLGHYLKKYKMIVLLFLLLLFTVISATIYYSISLKHIFFIFIFLFILLLDFQIFKRVKKEKEIGYLRSFPLLSITRGLGYLYGITKYLFIKK